MAKKFIKRFLPSTEKILAQKGLGIFNRWLHCRNLWYLNRRSASGAMALGLLVAFIPVPFQMILAAAGAIMLQVNLPLAVALVWLTNPFTMPPIFYVSYKLGAWILHYPPLSGNIIFSWEWLKSHAENIVVPFLVGTLLCGVVLALLGYFATRLLWRCSVLRQRRQRLQRQSERVRSALR